MIECMHNNTVWDISYNVINVYWYYLLNIKFHQFNGGVLISEDFISTHSQLYSRGGSTWKGLAEEWSPLTTGAPAATPSCIPQRILLVEAIILKCISASCFAEVVISNKRWD